MAREPVPAQGTRAQKLPEGCEGTPPGRVNGGMNGSVMQAF